ncbi:NCS2 family permease [Mollicutes bacterium LVI A0039]|nr:NCS2 family permease [Mollicutes bacterium LVI A0039]
MDKFFKLTDHKTTVKIEVIAGITTFLSMAYILVVNPLTLADGGMDAGAVFTATALSAIIATLIMGLYANFPVALAAGMGTNSFLTYSVVMGMGYTWQEGLFAIFISGLLFILLSATGLRATIINAIPRSIKYATSAGVGLFIAFIGMQNAGIIVDNPGILVSLGDLTVPTVMLAIIGTFITMFLVARDTPAAIFVGMAITTVIGILMQLFGLDSGIVMPEAVFAVPPSLEPVFGRLFLDVEIGGLLVDFRFWAVVISFLFVDFFDTAGTLVAVGSEAGFIGEDGSLDGAERALMADATATTIGAVVGTSSVTAYVESLSGVKAGGRTGLTAVVVAACFAIALFFSPILAIVTSSVTAPALITVGTLMAVNKGKINYENYADTAASFLTMLMMVVSYSIATGLATGIITYTVLKIAQKEHDELHPILYVLSVFFIFYFAML